MANYKSTTRSYVVKDWYGDDWQQATLTVTCAANGTITWSIAMDNSGTSDGWSYTSVSIYCYINGTKVYDGYYNSGTGTKYNFPTNKGSSKSGTLSTTASGGSFTVDLAVCCMQAATSSSNSGRLTNGTATRLKTGDAWGQTFSRDLATYTVTFNANGGNTPNPTSKTVTSGSTYGTLATCTKNTANNYSYSLKGWYTATSGGTQITSSSTVNISANQTLYAQWDSTLLTSACTAPTVTVSDTIGESFYIKCVAGSDGVGNAVSSVELFVTFDGTTPTTTNYQFHKSISCTAGQTKYAYVYPYQWTQECIEYYFGTDWVGTIKVAARTRGTAGSSFYSGLSSTVSATYEYMGKSNNGVRITNPSAAGITCGVSGDYITLTWEDDDLNTAEYDVAIIDLATNEYVYYDYVYDQYYSFPTSGLTANSQYYVSISKYDNNWNYIGTTYSRGLITTKAVSKFSVPSVTISPVGSFPAVKPFWRDDGYTRPLFLNNSKGNLCKLTWPSASAANNTIKGYEVHINVFDNSSSSAVTVCAEYIGDVTEYYVKADAFTNAVNSLISNSISIDKTYNCIECAVQIIAKSAYGEFYDSETNLTGGYRFFVITGSGIYIKTNKEGTEPIMKRAVAFARNELGDWEFAYDISKKDEAGVWQSSDTWYEIVTNNSSEPLLDLDTSEPIYSL